MAKRRPNGDGMIRKRKDGRWEGRIIIGHKEDGSPIMKYITTRTQRELVDRLSMLKEQYRGIDLADGYNLTLKEWIDKWLSEYAEPSLRQSTVKGYRRYAKYVCDRIGDIPLNKLTTAIIQHLYNELKENGREGNDPVLGKSLADSSVRSVHMLLHEALDYAVKGRLLPSNPTNGTTIPKANYKDKTVLDAEQLEAFMEAIEKEPEWFDFFYVEITVGMRKGEICALQWSDFNEKEKTLYVRRTCTKGKNGEEIGDTKTSTGKRIIKLPESTYQVLLRRKEKAVTEWIFPSLLDTTKHVASSAAYHKLKSILAKNNLPNIRFHDLRHTFATHAIKHGVDAKTLSGILGHTNASFTLDTYTHVTTDMRKDAAQIVGGILTNLIGEDDLDD